MQASIAKRTHQARVLDAEQPKQRVIQQSKTDKWFRELAGALERLPQKGVRRSQVLALNFVQRKSAIGPSYLISG